MRSRACASSSCEGDLLDPVSVRRAVAGVQTVYHVAADYRLWAPDPAVIYRTNVDGTRAVLEAAGDAGVARVVYTSSVGALGIPTDGTPGTEDTPVTLDKMVGHYKRSKFLAEALALDFARRGVPVVVVNPSAPIGPWDIKPTPTGQMIVDFMRGRMVATLDTGLNVVHVRDVARATCWRPSVASRARSTSSATPPEPLARRASSRCWPTSPAAARRASACRTRWRGWRAVVLRGRRAGHRPAAGGAADRGPHGAQADVLQPGQGRARARAAADRRPPSRWRDAVAWFAAHGYARRARRRMSLGSLSATLTRKSRSNFYYAFLTLPRARRDALYAVYAFCRTVDDVADLGHDRAAQRAELARWRDGRRAVLRAGPGARRIRSRCSCAAAVRAYPIPRAALEAIIDGCEMDLDARALRARRGPLSVLLPRGLGGRPLLHRDLRLHRPAGPRLRRDSSAPRCS